MSDNGLDGLLLQGLFLLPPPSHALGIVIDCPRTRSSDLDRVKQYFTLLIVYVTQNQDMIKLLGFQYTLKSMSLFVGSPQRCQIGTKLDKSGNFYDQISVHYGL